jgi:hypothetical protein
MTKSLPTLAAVALLGIVTLPSVASAADQELPRRAKAAHHRPLYCGCCGCLYVTYDYHRELRSTYGTNFDPRNYDQTEPHYYFGKVRAYPQYWTEPNELERPY